MSFVFPNSGLSFSYVNIFFMNQVEEKLLASLEIALNNKFIVPLINKSVSNIKLELSETDSISITKTIPVDRFNGLLPGQIKLCRIFALKANTKSRIERHTNSYQRTLTCFGEGDTKILENNVWKSNIRKGLGSSIENRWLSVPENTWHQPIALSTDWITITFHTASESEIIDEYKE